MFQIIQADAHAIPMKDKSVQCVVTSPPYWGLRDYGTARWEGGDEGCDHKVESKFRSFTNGRNEDQSNGYAGSNLTSWTTRDATPRAACPKCGATRIDSQIGLEKTPEEYVAKIVAVFAEVWRVLRDDGVAFVNLGDTYFSNPAKGGSGTFNGRNGYGEGYARAQRGESFGLKAKDLVGVPWRVAFALQAAGWYLRSDIIWSKPNPMPESVTDRPTKSHEYIFLLSKKERYFFDQDAVREDHQANSLDRYKYSLNSSTSGFIKDAREGSSFEKMRNGANMGEFINPAGRNIRTVWEIATQPFPSAHFATFPEEIAIRCIKAGTSEKGACKECGAPWERVIKASGGTIGKSWHNHEDDLGRGMRGGDDGHNIAADLYSTYKRETLGWQPTCKHDAPTTACVVLDPFAGAGTVPLVADKLNRHGIGLELKNSYCRMAHDRCYDDAPLLANKGIFMESI